MSQHLRRVTALDVAKEAGVSKTTVSYVLNETPHQKIPEETRDRVLAAVRRLNYTPNSVARALRLGHSDTVLLLMPDWPLGPVLAGIIDALTTALERHGLFLMMRRESAGKSLASLWQDAAPAAVVAFHDVDDRDVELMREAGVHVATALLTSERPSGQEFVLPQESIGALQVQHLASKGHTRIAYAALRDVRVQTFVDLRVRGAERAAFELGLAKLEVSSMDIEVEAAVETIERWKGLDPAVTAVAAYNDELAVAILAGLRASDLSAPRDLAVVGVDDEPLARFAFPPLTSVKQDERLIAGYLAQLIVSGMSGETAAAPVGPDSISLVVRDST
ncbi:LacI family DNA-binding transcriptional regulator [Naasia lichenicola]|uniref:LacI family transcriptional regulator n=1 Tax=Naasia lichenicola TaxID=2565933 RepID=A0A4S4FJM3_9MICO|nr:LacI family DNA-binding transcriptional regulator [Naasia lichenicola]THG29336.1 LacI family transcriptional regulator [Naasia lichenicola]